MFRLRSLTPKVSKWYEVKGETVEDAIQILHYDQSNHYSSQFPQLIYWTATKDGCEQIRFALIEAEGYEITWVSRVYFSGIFRKNPVLDCPRKLAEIAKDLGWTHPVEQLVEPWDS
jgi:hypothetical protein